MCIVSNIGDGYARTFPYRWPNIPIQPYQPWVRPKNPSEVPHQFQPTQDALKECVVCGKAREHSIHALFEAIQRKNPNATIVDKDEFDALKREVEELRELLLAARRFDEATGQPDCEMEAKVDLIRQVADIVGVDLDEVFGSRE